MLRLFNLLFVKKSFAVYLYSMGHSVLSSGDSWDSRFINVAQVLLLFEAFPDYSSQNEAFLGGAVVKNPSIKKKTQVQSLGQEDPLEKEIATHSSIPPEKSRGQRSLVGCSP